MDGAVDLGAEAREGRRLPEPRERAGDRGPERRLLREEVREEAAVEPLAADHALHGVVEVQRRGAAARRLAEVARRERVRRVKRVVRERRRVREVVEEPRREAPHDDEGRVVAKGRQRRPDLVPGALHDGHGDPGQRRGRAASADDRGRVGRARQPEDAPEPPPQRLGLEHEREAHVGAPRRDGELREPDRGTDRREPPEPEASPPPAGLVGDGHLGAPREVGARRHGPQPAPRARREEQHAAALQGTFQHGGSWSRPPASGSPEKARAPPRTARSPLRGRRRPGRGAPTTAASTTAVCSGGGIRAWSTKCSTKTILTSSPKLKVHQRPQRRNLNRCTRKDARRAL